MDVVGHKRRCGKCSQFFFISQGGHKTHKVYGVLCAKCVKERQEKAAAKAAAV